jgi:hypothetical protein
MKTMILLAKSVGLMLCLLLLSINTMAQDRNTANKAAELTSVEVMTTAPPQSSKADVVLNSEESSLPRPEISGNRDLDIENYRVAITRWAKEHQNEFLTLDEPTRDLFNNQQFAVLFDQAVNRVKGNTQTEK